MAARLFCKTTLQQIRFRNANRTFTFIHNFQRQILSHQPQLNGAAQTQQLLHVKIFDKDTSYDTQREANKYTTLEMPETIDEAIETERNVRNTRRRQRKNESSEINQRVEEKLRIPREAATESDVISQDPDVFGTDRATNEGQEEAEEDENDINSSTTFTRRGKKLRTKEYARLIKDHLNANHLREAIDVLEKQMLKEDRVKPENYIYNLLISGCAKAGYTRKAFSLFTRMRQRGLKVKGGTYTSLFNACANAPSASDGLLRANHVREIMLEKGYEPNVLNYNAMIKAYGRCGDVKTAYLLADEMMERNLELNADTFNFLLQACASDTKLGFRHCLLTWHKMLQRGIRPDYYTFHTVLRCVRDCGFGDLETMQKVLAEILGASQKIEITNETAKEPQLLLKKANTANVAYEAAKLDILQKKYNPFSDKKSTSVEAQKLQINPFSTTQNKSNHVVESNKPDVSKIETNNVSNKELEDDNKGLTSAEPANTNENPSIGEENAETNSDTKTESLQIANQAMQLEIPNLLAPRPHLGSLLSLTEVTRPHERFLLLGGLSGFLEIMKENRITPNIQMFTTILEVIPPTYAAEKQVLTYIRKIGLKADIDFFNVLIKKRSMRFDYEGAREVISMINTAGLHPDIVTYGVLALGCRTVEEARELLKEMTDKGARMNIQILGAMLRQGCAQKSFSYVTDIMQISLDEGIKPNEAFLTHLHKFYKQCARAIDARHSATKTNGYKQGHAKFCKKFRLYNEEQGIADLKLEDAIKKIRERPYEHYKEASVDGIEPLKNKKYTTKNKLRKYIKKIKINNLRSDEDRESSNKSKSIE